MLASETLPGAPDDNGTNELDPDTDNFQENLDPLSDDGAPPKPRKQRPKLTTEMLRSEKGLTYLYTKGRHIKYQGKGFEREDLKKLVQFYKFWAKDVFLRLSFPAFVDRAVKLNKSKEMKAYLSGLRHRERYGDSGVLAELSGETVGDAAAERDGDANYRVFGQDGMGGDWDGDDDRFGMEELEAAATASRNLMSSSSVQQPSLITETAVIRDQPPTNNHVMDESERIAQNRAAALARLAEKQRLRDLELQRMEEEAEDLPEDPWRVLSSRPADNAIDNSQASASVDSENAQMDLDNNYNNDDNVI